MKNNIKPRIAIICGICNEEITKGVLLHIEEKHPELVKYAYLAKKEINKEK